MQATINHLNIGDKIKVTNSWYEVIGEVRDHKRKVIKDAMMIRFLHIDPDYAKTLSPLILKGISTPREFSVKLPWSLYSLENIIRNESQPK